jgi:hypothetical protein
MPPFITFTAELEPSFILGEAFVVDAKIEDHYKDTIRGICQTIRRAADFAN